MVRLQPHLAKSPTKLSRGVVTWRIFHTMSCLLALCGVSACSGDNDLPPVLDHLGNPNSEDDQTCEVDTERRCAVTLNREGGRLSCWEGVQHCMADQRWGECVDGQVVEHLDPFDPQFSRWFREQSLSMPVECGASNPCDPGCHIYEEPGPFVAGAGDSTTEWETGPTPVWTPPAACAVADLCAENPTPLDSNCHACVTMICAQPGTDHCCSDGASPTSWDQACTDAVYSVCDMSAAPSEPPNGGFCDFGALAQGSLRFGNGGLSGSAVGSNGVGTEMLLESSTPCAYRSVMTRGRLNLRNSCAIQGDILAQGDVYLETGSSAQGVIWSGGGVELRNAVTAAGGVTAVGEIELNPGVMITGDVWSGTNLELIGNSRIVGNVTTRGFVNMLSGSSISGDLLVGTNWSLTNSPSVDELVGNSVVRGNVTGSGNIVGDLLINTGSSLDSGVTYSGTLTTGASTPLPAAPSAPAIEVPDVNELERDLDSECGIAGAAGTTVFNSDVTLLPGIYGRVQLNSGALLHLLPGNYAFFGLDIVSGDIRLDPGTQLTPNWDLSICEDLLGGSNHRFYLRGTTNLPQPSQLILYSRSTADFAIRFFDNNVINAMMLAPNGRVYLGNNNVVGGALWGDRIYTETSTVLNQGSTASCESTSLWGASCAGYGLYTNGTSYSLGSEVHYQRRTYRCVNAANCSAGGGYGGSAGYWPGEGLSWAAAWTLLGDCTVPDLPDFAEPMECPVAAAPYPALYSTPCATGRDCQSNFRCENPATGAACAHSKCTEGGFLALGCDACVDLMCDPDGDGSTTDPCCLDSGTGSEWSAACVARVATACDASCGEAATGCEHDVCVQGGGMVQNTSCSSCVADICSARPSCCSEDGTAATNEWDATCVELAASSCGAPGASICDYAAFGSFDLETGDFLRVTGGAIGGDSNGLHALAYDSSIEDLITFSNTCLYDATVENVYSTGSITLYGVSSAVSENATQAMTAPDVPTKSFTCGSTAAGDRDFGSSGGTSDLPPGNYRHVSIDSGAIRLTAGGDYNIASLTMGDDTSLRIPAGATVNLNLCSHMQLGERVQFVAHSGPSLTTVDALRVRIHAAGTTPNDSSVGAGSTIFAVLTAPNSRISMTALSPATGVTWHGLIRARETSIHDYTRVIADGVAGAACHVAGLGDAGPAPACSVSTPLDETLPEGGECVENERGYQDSSCAGIDLALGAPCGETIPICNHGSLDFDGSVDLTFWPENAGVMATEAPEHDYVLGTCPFTGVIAAGSCVSHDCSATGLLDQNLTVMVNAPSGGAVTECSGLDNWTLFTPGQTCSAICQSPPCIAQDTPVQFVEEYVATCPDAMSPLWSSLAWEAETPDTSVVRFEASIDAPPSASYSLLGSTDISGDSCALVGPSPCPVDITQELDLGVSNHPDTLYLRMTLTPGGGQPATLSDWRVTYTCVFDQ